jgi:outer membrane receptor protein involved in Fe transport
MTIWKTGAALAAIVTATTAAHAQTAPDSSETAASQDAGNDIVVVGQAVSFANTKVTEAMIDRQSALTSVNDVLNELPGVLVTEGDAFGSSDWATSITIRGFTSNRDTQQIGTTIDGLPNGGSGYGGGSRANRYLDVLNLATVQVSQGTGDIASRSNEALGGTLNYVTSDPAQERRLRVVLAGGDYSSRKAYIRADTGEIAPDTYVWISASAARSHDWIDGSGHTRRDHIAGKIISKLAGVDLTAYASYDDADESEYGSVSAAGFANNPNADGLLGDWVGIPYIDQNYRSGSRALRKNLFGYLKAHAEAGEINLTVTGYGHKMRGRGDWIPPYLVNVTNDGVGAPNSEFLGGGTVFGGANIGQIYFVTPTGATAPMTAGCVGSAGIPAAYDPSCYPAGSTPVQSYRHTHYKNRRLGALVDFDWKHEFGDVTNLFRAGTWYENGRSNNVRDWHKLTDARVGYAFNDKPYWVQFTTDYGVDEFMYYAEDVLTWGGLSARVGVKQFFLDQSRQELLNDRARTERQSHSDPLLSLGLTWATPVAGLEVFGGYSQNFAAIGRGLLEQDQAVVREIEPETADNIELGVRYSGSRLQGSLTLYDIKFNNRIIFVPSDFVTGIDYLDQVDGIYLNVGGIKSRGVEASLAYRLPGGITLSGAYTYNRAKYLGSGNAAQDAAIGITPGVQVFNSPKHMFVASADWRRDGWKAGVSSKYVGDRFIDTRGTGVAESFILTNAYAGVDLGAVAGPLKGLDFTLTVNNLTDERYLAGADGGSAFLGAPRTVTASLTLDF